MTFPTLSLTISELCSKYHIFELKEKKEALARQYPQLVNLLENYEFMSPAEIDSIVSNLDTNQLIEVEERYNEIKKQYSLNDFIKKANEAREKFFSTRKNYFFNSTKILGKEVGIDIKKLHIPSRLDFEFMEEEKFSVVLDKILRRHRDKKIRIKYENLHGDVVSFVAGHKPLEITKDYVYAKPIDRTTGISEFDRLLLHAIFDTETKEYRFVPIRMIVEISGIDNE